MRDEIHNYKIYKDSNHYFGLGESRYFSAESQKQILKIITKTILN